MDVNNLPQMAIIDTSDISGAMEPHISLTIPHKLLKEFNDDDNVPIRVASTLYRNVTNLFTDGINSK